MRRINKINKNVIILIIVITIMSSSLLIYFGVVYKKTEITIKSFDRKVTLSLGKHRIGRITEDNHYNNIVFYEKEDSVLKTILNNRSLISTRTVSTGDTIYLLLYNNYYYTVWCKNNDKYFIIHSAYITLSGQYYPDLHIPIIAEDSHTVADIVDGTNIARTEWRSLYSYDDFDMVIESIKNVNQDYVADINEDERVIRLYPYARIDSDEYSIVRDVVVIVTEYEGGLQFVVEGYYK
ncbi:MAG: hypothetical protein LBF12_01910 [Christensenellaceae bacterium]|jgi:hypothetical protein|nr:hypothetical protein [Christensenellaceae bacterium]